MIFTGKDIKKYQEIYKYYYGKECSREHVLEQGPKLIRLVEILLEEAKKDKYRTKEERQVILKKLEKSHKTCYSKPVRK